MIENLIKDLMLVSFIHFYSNLYSNVWDGWRQCDFLNIKIHKDTIQTAVLLLASHSIVITKMQMSVTKK